MALVEAATVALPFRPLPVAEMATQRIVCLDYCALYECSYLLTYLPTYAYRWDRLSACGLPISV